MWLIMPALFFVVSSHSVTPWMAETNRGKGALRQGTTDHWLAFHSPVLFALCFLRTKETEPCPRLGDSRRGGKFPANLFGRLGTVSCRVSLNRQSYTLQHYSSGWALNKISVVAQTTPFRSRAESLLALYVMLIESYKHPRKGKVLAGWVPGDHLRSRICTTRTITNCVSKVASNIISNEEKSFTQSFLLRFILESSPKQNTVCYVWNTITFRWELWHVLRKISDSKELSTGVWQSIFCVEKVGKSSFLTQISYG